MYVIQPKCNGEKNPGDRVLNNLTGPEDKGEALEGRLKNSML